MKKTILSAIGVAFLASCLMGCSVQAKVPSNDKVTGSTPQSSSQLAAAATYGGDDGSISIKTHRLEAFKQYEQFGLTYDAKKDVLNYKGKLVRWFEDYYPVGDNGQSGHDFFNESGVVDVHAVRDLSSFVTAEDGSIDPSGKLTGLKEFSQREFENRNIEAIKNPPTSAALADDLLTSGEMEKIAAEYKDFGVTYETKSNQWFLNAEKVRYFRDVMTTNGESLTSGKFSGAIRTLGNGSGTIDIYTIRDFTKPTADGVGALRGIEKYSQQEFDKHTQDGKSSNTGGGEAIVTNSD